MGLYKRSGNFGIVDTPQGLASFSVGAGFSGIGPTANYNFSVPNSWFEERMRIGRYEIIPMGYNNELPKFQFLMVRLKVSHLYICTEFRSDVFRMLSFSISFIN